MAQKISESSLVETVFVAPGNGGTGSQFINISIDVLDFESIGKEILKNQIQLVVVGPEKPLVHGIIDYFENHPNPSFKSVHFIGPNQACAQLEGSKEFSKKIMLEAGIPTARAKSFSGSEWEECLTYIENQTLPVVIKADGLASGKGVAVCNSTEEAIEFAKRILIESEFGIENHSLLVEDFLEGIEVSMFLLSDGVHYCLLPEAKDYKRIFDGDHGPNTGGMGSVTPVPFVTQSFTEKVEQRVVRPLFDKLNEMGLSYKGFLFIGLMNNKGEPSVVEFNTRLGDPETQSILQRIDSDLVPAFLSIKKQQLHEQKIEISNRSVVTLVISSENYPENPVTGRPILFADLPRTGKIFHSGTRMDNKGNLFSAGGRVVSCTAFGIDIKNAIHNVYQLPAHIHLDGMHYRKDIGLDILNLIPDGV